MGDSNGNLSQALAVLGDEKSSHISLSSKIDFLEKKGLSSSEVLDALKLASSSGALKLAGGRMKYDWVWSTVVPWVSVIGVGLVTYYFTGDCNDSEDEMNNDNLHATNDLLTQNSISISQESSSSMEVATSINKPNNTVEEPEWAKQVSKSANKFLFYISCRKSHFDAYICTIVKNGIQSADRGCEKPQRDWCTRCVQCAVDW